MYIWENENKKSLISTIFKSFFHCNMKSLASSLENLHLFCRSKEEKKRLESREAKAKDEIGWFSLPILLQINSTFTCFCY